MQAIPVDHRRKSTAEGSDSRVPAVADGDWMRDLGSRELGFWLSPPPWEEVAEGFARMGRWKKVGRWHVRIICNKIFNDIADKEKRSLSLNDLHVATLRVYNSANKQFLSPHKEPPSVVDVADKIEAYHSQGIEAITLEEFYRLIMEWIRKDLHIVFANKVLAASLGAPALAAITKNAGRQLPRIKDVSEKIPTSLLFTIYFVGVILL
ncbi:hypothetical protein COCNU_10G009780 [Cocos nucifera]|uniref:Uncharacterized protein n=1 Tax=Cocos nucifera TaxID=13894 RepID=A0A8K0IN29_COCNU|nr:hypothetical protein COCNU_10G009780 [Cocos nucifera]